MDFIERIFGFAPDGGSGAFEFILFLVPLVGVCYLALVRMRRAATSLHSSAPSLVQSIEKKMGDFARARLHR